MMAQRAQSSTGRVCLGVIVGAKGLRGEVRIKSFTEGPDGLSAYGPVSNEDGSQRFKLKVVGTHKDVVIARLDGVNVRTAAERLKGVQLFIDRSALPDVEDGTYYHADLIGLAVELIEDQGGAPRRIGHVKSVQNFGGGDILEVAIAPGAPGNGSELVPFTAEIVAAVDVKAGIVRLNKVPGLFEDDDQNDDTQRNEGDDDTPHDETPDVARHEQ